MHEFLLLFGVKKVGRVSDCILSQQMDGVCESSLVFCVIGQVSVVVHRQSS